MGWNEPNKGNDPWGGNKQQPPDLDEVFKRLQKNLKKFFGLNGKGTMRKSKRSKLNMPKNGGAFVGSFCGIVFVFWLLAGIFIVDPAEQAAILRFGKYISTVGPGPHWIPRFIYSKTMLNVDRVSDYSYSANMLTKDENLVSVAVAVQYKIGDLQDYLFKISDV